MSRFGETPSVSRREEPRNWEQLFVGNDNLGARRRLVIWVRCSSNREEGQVFAMTTENVVDANGIAEESRDCGYASELKRTLGSFQVFAVSFAFISVAVGIFGTYDDVLPDSGPVGIWLWVIVAVGQTLVVLVIAQFAARIPLSGSSYQWASRLANP